MYKEYSQYTLSARFPCAHCLKAIGGRTKLMLVYSSLKNRFLTRLLVLNVTTVEPLLAMF